MKRFYMFAAGLFLTVTMAACAAAGGFSNEKIRYKMTVTVETPEGVKTGSAVREAGRYTEPSILPDQGGTFYNITKGEAVAVDLGQRGVLFVLLGRGDEARTIFKALAITKKHEALTLSLPQYPKIIYFKDKKDPSTAELVLETDACPNPVTGVPRGSVCLKRDRFIDFFGTGTKLRSISVEKSDEEITEKVLEWLSWLPAYYNQRLDEQSR